MATYFKLSQSGTGSIIQSSKERNKKFAVYVNAQMKIEFDANPANEINSVFRVGYQPLNAQNIILDNVVIDKVSSATLLKTAVPVAIEDNIAQCLPSHNESLILGFSDHPLTAISSKNDFFNQCLMTIPFLNDGALEKQRNIQFSRAGFSFTKNEIYICSFYQMSTLQTGDVQGFKDFIDTRYGTGYTVQDMIERVNVFVNGVME